MTSVQRAAPHAAARVRASKHEWFTSTVRRGFSKRDPDDVPDLLADLERRTATNGYLAIGCLIYAQAPSLDLRTPINLTFRPKVTFSADRVALFAELVENQAGGSATYIDGGRSALAA